MIAKAKDLSILTVIPTELFNETGQLEFTQVDENSGWKIQIDGLKNDIGKESKNQELVEKEGLIIKTWPYNLDSAAWFPNKEFYKELVIKTITSHEELLLYMASIEGLKDQALITEKAVTMKVENLQGAEDQTQIISLFKFLAQYWDKDWSPLNLSLKYGNQNEGPLFTVTNSYERSNHESHWIIAYLKDENDKYT